MMDELVLKKKVNFENKFEVLIEGKGNIKIRFRKLY